MLMYCIQKYAQSTQSQYTHNIDLSDNNFGAKGAEYLGEAFSKNTSLAVLNISKNKICANGAKDLFATLGSPLVILSMGLRRYGLLQVRRRGYTLPLPIYW